MVQRRRFLDEFTLHEQLINPASGRCQFLPLVPGLLREPPPIIVEREDGLPVRGDLADLAGREVRWQPTVLECFSPPQPSPGAFFRSPGERLFGLRDAVSKDEDRPFTGGHFLKPVYLGLCRCQPSFEPQAGVGAKPGVECSHLGCQLISPSPRRVALPPGRFQTGRGVAIE